MKLIWKKSQKDTWLAALPHQPMVTLFFIRPLGKRWELQGFCLPDGAKGHTSLVGEGPEHLKTVAQHELELWLAALARALPSMAVASWPSHGNANALHLQLQLPQMPAADLTTADKTYLHRALLHAGSTVQALHGVPTEVPALMPCCEHCESPLHPALHRALSTDTLQAL